MRGRRALVRLPLAASSRHHPCSVAGLFAAKILRVSPRDLGSTLGIIRKHLILRAFSTVDYTERMPLQPGIKFVRCLKAPLSGAQVLMLTILVGLLALGTPRADAQPQSQGKTQVRQTAAKPVAAKAGATVKKKAGPTAKKTASATAKKKAGPVRKKKRVVRRAAPRPSVAQLQGLRKTEDPLDLKSSVALVVDQDTQEVLFSKNPDAVLPIA